MSAERREEVRQFYNKWVNRGKEDEDDRSFWIDFLTHVLGVEDATDRIEFQKKVIGPDGNTKRIDAYIPETKVLIEQKSLNIDLSKPQQGHDGMTPYEQAKMYDNSLPVSEKARWIVLSNFAEIWVYDMDTRKPEPTKFVLSDIPSKYSEFTFLIDKTEKINTTREQEISIQAAELVGKLSNALEKQYIDPSKEESQRSLNLLCTRLVFCLYAEDAHIFGADNHMFHDYLEKYEPADIRKALIELFKILDTKPEDRDPYDNGALSKFPYVNGGLFKDEAIEIPNFNEEIRDILLVKASEGFDWSEINSCIFGNLFECSLNAETRHSKGMHYTNVSSIHKVIDPLFLDSLTDECEKLLNLPDNKQKKTKLEAYQDKLASLTFADFSCGSGNFLTEIYICLRRLENKVIRAIFDLDKKQVSGQIVLGDAINPIKVSIRQFYGCELTDTAYRVALVALWISEAQMLKETEDILSMTLDFLPLKTNANIVEGNALEIDWNTIVPKEKLNYIVGNPPFIGARWMNENQKNDVYRVFGKDWEYVSQLDYVCCWFKLATEFMKGTNIKAALVSTNSVAQGTSVTNLWKHLFNEGIHINFAYRTFVWESEALTKAKVHCVIIGFGMKEEKEKILFDEDGKCHKAGNINGYLLDADNIFIEKSMFPICSVPEITIGAQPLDDGNLILTEEEKDELIKRQPQIAPYIRPYMMAKEFLERKPRYCIWLNNAEPSLIKKCPEIMERVERIKEFRSKSSRHKTLKAAERPSQFALPYELATDYIAIPKVTSENRRYIPIDYLSKDIIPGDKLFTLPDATMYHFGILSSNVHMAWVRAICGRLKSDYSYSNTLVYNNFPWPEPTKEQKEKIEKTAKGIIDARNLYPSSNLADLYDELTMPIEVRKAHQENDKAVMQAYGFPIRDTSEADCVAKLMQMYKGLTEGTK